MRSLVTIMAISGKHVHMNFCFENSIHQTVLLRDGATPTVFRLPFQGFRMPCAAFRMYGEFIQQLDRLLEGSRLTSFQLGKSFLGFRSIGDSVHGQSELSQRFMSSRFVKVVPLPSAISLSALSTRAKNSSRVISVGSAFRSATSFLAYRVRRFIRGSLSAMAPMLCQSSMFMELSCMAVISILWFYWLQRYD